MNTVRPITPPGRIAIDTAFFVDVIITARNNPNHIHETRRINYHSDGARRWLAKASHWALHHGYAVHTAASEGMPIDAA